MNETTNLNSNSNSVDNVFTYETVNERENIVKVISFNDGVKNEVYVQVLSEEQFNSLLPVSERETNQHILIAD